MLFLFLFADALKILRAHEFVMGGWVVLGKIISSVGFSGSPVKIELLLGNEIFKPMIAHLKSFGLFHANLGMKNTASRRVVGF